MLFDFQFTPDYLTNKKLKISLFLFEAIRSRLACGI